MRTFRLVKEAGLTRPETKISPRQEDPGLDADGQIDLETQLKVETTTQAQRKATVFPGRRILEVLGEGIAGLGAGVTSRNSHVVTTRGEATGMKAMTAATGGIEDPGIIPGDLAGRGEGKDVTETVRR